MCGVWPCSTCNMMHSEKPYGPPRQLAQSSINNDELWAFELILKDDIGMFEATHEGEMPVGGRLESPDPPPCPLGLTSGLASHAREKHIDPCHTPLRGRPRPIGKARRLALTPRFNLVNPYPRTMEPDWTLVSVARSNGSAQP